MFFLNWILLELHFFYLPLVKKLNLEITIVSIQVHKHFIKLHLPLLFGQDVLSLTLIYII